MKKAKNIADATLVVAYQSGDKRALSILVKRWHVSFCKFAYWYVKDANIAKDIAQESWTIIIKKIKWLKEPEKFKSWAISIVNRKAIDWIRVQSAENKKLQSFYNQSSRVISEEDETDDNNKRAILLQSIYKLSEDQQMVIKLFYAQNYTLKEISEILQISVGTTKSRLFHAREKLKTILKNKNYG
ncbi:MAG: RNA polymerase sigma factor [Flavobacteriaceae bacterium]